MLVSTISASSNSSQVNMLLIHIKQPACLLYIPHAKSITGGSFMSSGLTPRVFDFLISEPVNLKKIPYNFVKFSLKKKNIDIQN